MLNALLVDMKLDNLNDFSNVGTDTIRGACSDIDVAELQQILTKYTSTEDMFTQNYLHGRKENIKLLVDIGKVIDALHTNPDKAHDMAHEMMEKLGDWEPLYVRCLVQVFKAWYIKSDLVKTHPLDEVKVEAEALSDVQVVQTDEFGLIIAQAPVAAK
jgi:hypothetical protein